MRALLISLGLLLLTIAMILCNALYINRMTFEFKSRLESLPDTPDKGIDTARELLDFWKANKGRIGLSASDVFTDRITEQAVLLSMWSRILRERNWNLIVSEREAKSSTAN